MGALRLGLSSACLSFSRAYSRIVSSITKRDSPCRRLDLLHQAFVHHGRHTIKQVKSRSPWCRRRLPRLQACIRLQTPIIFGKVSARRIQQIVAPIDGSAKSLLPLRQVSRSARQQLQLAGQACPHGGWRKNFDARGGELDGERQAVQPGTNLSNRGCVFLVQFKIWLDRRWRAQRTERPPGTATVRQPGARTANPAEPVGVPEIHVPRTREAPPDW